MSREGSTSLLAEFAPPSFRNIGIAYAPFRFDGDQAEPFVIIELPQVALVAENFVDSLSRSFDQREQAYGLVIGLCGTHHGLPSQSRAQIALRAGHDSQTSHHVVVNFAAAAVDFLIHGGKVVLQVDPLPYDLGAGHDGFEQPPVGVAAVIVRMEKYSAVELHAAGQRSPRYNKSRIAR